jgi:hypothetical protein
MGGPPPGYVEVSERIAEFRAAYPDGSLQAEVVELRDDLVIVKAYAYRTPDDPRPGTGLASEPVPGKTNFTRDSELMNAETSAWGRALIAVGAADAKRGIASANEVRNRQTQDVPAPRRESPPGPKPDTANRVQAILSKAGVPLSALTTYVERQFGVAGFMALDRSGQESILTGLDKGVLLDDLKKLAEDAA